MSLNSERFPLTSGLRNKHSENDGFKVIFVCFLVFSIAITVALIVQIHYGNPEVLPHGAVSSDHQKCSAIGTDLLRAGGSAVDAAIAAALCMAVVHPHSTGLGGGGFMLIHNHAQNHSSVVDFREVAPAATASSGAVPRTGPGSAAVPGLLRGLQLAHGRHGRLAWTELARPSVPLARDGVPVSRQLSDALSSHLTVAEANAWPGMKVFLSGERLLQTGETLLQADLADTLERIQTGAKALYDGALTGAMLTELTSAGGVLTAADLSDYKPLQYQGLLRDYGQFRVLTAAAPSAGPALLAALELVRLTNTSQLDDPGLRYHRVTEALRISMEQFAKLGDPQSSESVTNSTAELLAPETLAELSGRIRDAGPAPPGPLPALDTPAATHISVIDDHELYVSLVTGLGSFFGSKFRTLSGILFSDAMAAFFEPALAAQGTENVPQPGRRPLATFSPAILMSHKVCGRRVVTGGSDASLLAQAVIRLVEPEQNLTYSLEAPRLHCSPESVQLGVEGGRPMQIAESVLQSLRDKGHQTYVESPPFPSCNGVTKFYDQLSSHADSRGGGTAVRY